MLTFSEGCVLCGRPVSEVVLLVAGVEQARGACDVCIMDGIFMLPLRGRVEVRRATLKDAVARLANVPAAAGPRAVLQGALLAIPEPPLPYVHLAQHSDGRRCVLCGGWSQGFAGIDGKHGALCGGCIVHAVPSLAPDALWLLFPFVVSFGSDRVTIGDSTPVLQAFLDLAVTADDLRFVDAEATRIASYPVAIRALSRIPVAERTEDDVFTLAHHHHWLGDPKTALALHDTLSVPTDPARRAYYLLNRTAFTLDLGDADEATLARCEADIAEVIAALRRLDDAKNLGKSCAHLAELHARRGRMAESEREALLARDLFSANGRCWELLGKLRSARGDLAGAKQAWQDWRDQSHPDDPTRASVERLLSALP